MLLSKSGRAPATVRVTASPLVRFAYGAALLAVPGGLIELAGARPADARAKRVARVLGARHCLQAALVGRSRAPIAHVLAVPVDLLHALSMAGLATFDRTYRRAEIIDGGIATAFASAQVRALRRAR